MHNHDHESPVYSTLANNPRASTHAEKTAYANECIAAMASLAVYDKQWEYDGGVRLGNTTGMNNVATDQSQPQTNQQQHDNVEVELKVAAPAIVPQPVQLAFKVRTAEDYGHVEDKPTRKEQSVIACESCRRRKIRCRGGEALSQSACDPCLSQQRECNWPDVPRSKRRRLALNPPTSQANDRVVEEDGQRSPGGCNRQPLYQVDNSDSNIDSNSNISIDNNSNVSGAIASVPTWETQDMQEILSGISGRQVYELVQSGRLALHVHPSPPPDQSSLLSANTGQEEESPPFFNLDFFDINGPTTSDNKHNESAGFVDLNTNVGIPLVTDQEASPNKLLAPLLHQQQEGNSAHIDTSILNEVFGVHSGTNETTGPANSTFHSVSSNQISEKVTTTTHPSKVDSESIVRVKYYRHFGPTAIVPGRKRVSLRLKCRPDHIHQVKKLSPFGYGAPDDASSTLQDYPITNPPFLYPTSSEPFPIDDNPLFDDSTNLPNPEILHHLLDVFFCKVGDHFPFLCRSRIAQSISDGEASAFLICAMCALSARFTSIRASASSSDSSPGEGTRHWANGAVFAARAKASLGEVISVPSVEHAAGFIILAWVEFGDNNDSGLWIYSGLAARMVQDLGLQRERSPLTPSHYVAGHNHAESSSLPRDSESEVNISTERLLFWCVFVMDTTLSWGTGRPPAISLEEVTVQPPTQRDMDLARPDRMGIDQGSVAVFPFCIKMMLSYSMIIKNLNATMDESSSGLESAKEGSTWSCQLDDLRDTIIRDYQSLPPEITFSGSNYKTAIKTQQAGVYIALHLFFPSILACILRCSIQRASKDGIASTYQSGTGNPAVQTGQSNQKGKEAQDLKARDATTNSIVGILTICDIIDDFDHLATTPFINQCLFASACICIEDIGHISQRDFLRVDANPNAQSSESFLSSLAKSNYHFIRRALRKQAEYFSGVQYIDDVLSQREQGLRDSDIEMTALNEGTATVTRLMGLNAIKTTSGQPARQISVNGMERGFEQSPKSPHEWPDINDFFWSNSESLQNINANGVPDWETLQNG